MHHPSDWVGLAFFTLTNTLMVIGLDALQHKAALVAAATEARHESAHFLQETQEAQARLQSVTEAARDQRRRELLPHLLMPELPAQIAGLDLRVHYEALLKDDGLGTPFFDSFDLGQNRTALVVGAVANSGLAATADVALTRNMLRSAIYRCASLTEAVAELNALLAARQLLSGPGRLAVVLFDAASCAASSVSCGPTASLVRRAATGQVEDLAEAGPLLGRSEDFAYRERRQKLAPGDILLLSPGLAAGWEEKAGETPGVSCWRRALEKSSPMPDVQQLIAELVRIGLEECPPGVEESLCLLAARVTDSADK